jgi:FkbM family methyltransferase
MILKIKDVLRRLPIYPLLRSVRNAGFSRSTAQADAKRREFYSQFIRPGDLVFDVGANMGNRTRVFLDLGAKVVAFEPQKSCADFLQGAFHRNPDFRLVRKALGSTEGFGEMWISNSHPLSSLSTEWIDATRRSGRFANYSWDRKQPVALTTLDQSIREFGRPSFVKIDVEGYEYEVLAGLSEPLDSLSIEFTPEYRALAFRCIERIEETFLKPLFQLSLGESMNFFFPEWVTARILRDSLCTFENPVFGDIYIRRDHYESG